MMRQLALRSLLTLCFFSKIGFFFVECAEIKNGAVRSGWQPVLNYDNVGTPSPLNNHPRYSYYEPENQQSKSTRKSQEIQHQQEYTPPSILGSFSIFGHSLPKNRERDDTKSINKNEYDFLMPPPRQKIEPYQKLKISSDLYNGPSQYRDIYTPINNHFTIIPTGSASSLVKKYPGHVIREEYPLRQHTTSIDNHNKPHHPKLPPWMQPARENIDPYHVNSYRQHPPHHNEPPIDSGNRYYTQISHPPVFKQVYEAQKPLKPPVTTTDISKLIPHHIEHYLFDHNSSGKQKLEGSSSNLHTAPGSLNYYNVNQKQNITTNWPVSSTQVIPRYSELLPKYNKPVQFNRPETILSSQPYIIETNLNTRIIPEKILPNVPKTQYETPESISLKHFNEQQFLLQQQLLERDRQKLEELQLQNTSPASKVISKPKQVESSTTVKSTYDDHLQVYESTKLINGEKNLEKRLNIQQIKENHSPKHQQEFEPITESVKYDYYQEELSSKAPETVHFSGKKKKNHNRIIVSSASHDYDRQIIPNGKQSSEVHPEESSPITGSPSTIISEFIPETKPIITTPTEVSITQSSTSFITESEKTSSTIPETTTRKSTTAKIRSQSRNPTRRRRPILEPESTVPLISSTEPTTSSTTETLEILNYSRQRPTSSYYTSEKIQTTTEIINEPTFGTKHPNTEQEDKRNTIIPAEISTYDHVHASETTEENISSPFRSPTLQYDHIESTSPLIQTSKSQPEEPITRASARYRTTTKDPFSIAPLENLFNFTQTIRQTSTPRTQSISFERKNNNEIVNSSTETVEITTRTSYRLRPMKFGNNTRPRFSVKDYKSRVDYRNRVGQSSTTEASSMITPVMKSKGMAKYKYTPRHSHSKGKISAQSYSNNKTSNNETDVADTKKHKNLSGNRVFTVGGFRNRGLNQTDPNSIEIKGHQNGTKSDMKFIQPIRRRPHLKTSAQLTQMIKKNKNVTKISVTTQSAEIIPTDKLISTIIENDVPKTKIKNTMKNDSANESRNQHQILSEQSESTTQEITKELLQNTSVQSDEDIFAKASQSVADLTSSASALYNQPGMFKALSSIPYVDSGIHKKSFKPIIDEPSLPIEAFFRGLSQSKDS